MAVSLDRSFALLLLQIDQPASFLKQVTAGKLGTAVLIALVTWLAVRWQARLFDFLGGRVARGRFFFKRLDPVVRIALWFAATLLIIELLAPSRETFWAGIASLGLALGLGAQDLVKNIVGGLIIVITHPYQLGDRVRIGEAYGEVDYIGILSTKLTTPDDNRVSLPNSLVVTGEVFNANSGVPDCQVVTDLYLPIDADPDEAVRLGREAALTSPFLLTSKPVDVLLGDVLDGRPYVRLRIKAYVHDHRYEPRLRSDVTVRTKRELLRQGLLRSLPGAAGADGSGFRLPA